MAWPRTLGVGLLALLMMAAPAMACLAPLGNASAHDCCPRKAAMDCGAMQMPAANNCCSAPAVPQQNSMTARAKAAPQSQAGGQVVVAGGARCAVAGRLHPAPVFSPLSPPSSVSILRI